MTRSPPKYMREVAHNLRLERLAAAPPAQNVAKAARPITTAEARALFVAHWVDKTIPISTTPE